jgi:hypothetical protein
MVPEEEIFDDARYMKMSSDCDLDDEGAPVVSFNDACRVEPGALAPPLQLNARETVKFESYSSSL